jgi:hypothetical protein
MRLRCSARVLVALVLVTGCPEQAAEEEGSSTLPDGGALGCAAPSSCDKGELEGSARVTTEEDIAEIAGHTAISGWLEVYQTEAECLEFLACMEDVGRDVTVFGNAQLRTLEGLDGLERIGVHDDGNLIVSENDALEDLDGVANLRAIPGSLSITRHDNLVRVTGLQRVQAIGFDITIQQNPALTSLSGLHDLQAVEGRFIVTQNPELCISEIERVGADLAVGPNGGSTASNKGGC